MSSKLFDLSRTTGLVTASARGLGNALANAFARLDEVGISVDILVNNAGIQLRKSILDLQRSGSFHNARPSHYEKAA